MAGRNVAGYNRARRFNCSTGGQNREGSKALLVDAFKMPSGSAAAAYDLGVKIFGRDGIPTDKRLKNLLTATKEELKLQADISPEAVMDLSIVRDAQRDLGFGKAP